MSNTTSVTYVSFIDGIVVRVLACYEGDPGSIPYEIPPFSLRNSVRKIEIGEAGRRSLHLSRRKRAPYRLSYIPVTYGRDDEVDIDYSNVFRHSNFVSTQG